MKMWMSARPTMEAVLRHASMWLALSNVPVVLGTLWPVMDEAAMVS